MDSKVKAELDIYLEKSSVKGTWVEKNLPNLWMFIDNFEGKSFSEKIYRFLNKENLQDSCKICRNKTQFLSLNRGYREFCSKTCSNNDPDSISKKIESFKTTSMDKWGVDNPMKNEVTKRKLIDSKSKLDYEKIN